MIYFNLQSTIELLLSAPSTKNNNIELQNDNISFCKVFLLVYVSTSVNKIRHVFKSKTDFGR